MNKEQLLEQLRTTTEKKNEMAKDPAYCEQAANLRDREKVLIRKIEELTQSEKQSESSQESKPDE